MARKYPPDIDDAISAALARGEQPSTIYDRLTRGTLDGLTRPVDMPRRTFRYRVQRIRERMAEHAARDACRQSGPSLAEMLTSGHDEVRAMADQGKSAHEVIREVDFLPSRDGTLGNIPLHAPTPSASRFRPPRVCTSITRKQGPSTRHGSGATVASSTPS